MDEKMTIVVPVLNRAGLVTRTLDSIAAQTYRPLRLVIVDNGSSDRTLDIVTAWAKANRAPGFCVDILSEPRRSASLARNRGLEATETEYVMFFDSDDIMESNHLERVMRHLEEHNYPDLVYWDMLYRDPDGWTTRKIAGHPNLMAEHIVHATVCTIRYCIRTSLLREIGGWNGNLNSWDDLELGVRILARKPSLSCSYMPGGPSVIHTGDDAENAITRPRFCDSANDIDKALDEIEKTIADSPVYLFILAARRAILAAEYSREGASALAKETLGRSLRDRSPGERRLLRLVYLTQRLFGHGGSFLTMNLLLPKTDPAKQ